MSENCLSLLQEGKWSFCLRSPVYSERCKAKVTNSNANSGPEGMNDKSRMGAVAGLEQSPRI